MPMPSDTPIMSNFIFHYALDIKHLWIKFTLMGKRSNPHGRADKVGVTKHGASDMIYKPSTSPTREAELSSQPSFVSAMKAIP